MTGFYKVNKKDKTWRIKDESGKLLVSFDKKKIYDLWTDYPFAMTEEEIRIFDKEHPYWAKFFAHRKEYPKAEPYAPEDKAIEFLKASKIKKVKK